MAKLTPGQLGLITAEMVHALIGAYLFYLLSAYFPGSLYAVGVAYGGLFAFEVWKEFWLDLRTEQGATVWGGVLDLTMYYVGAGLGLLALVLTHKPL
ncbi:MAG: hypothetical protein IVW52_04995 [Acidimicrobiales bacterium]|nr:hypothetical protein [Acidimicrobiales bacterium]